jgi:hypothetical protein
VILTVTQLREHIPGLPFNDDTIERYLEAAEEDIRAYAGPSLGVTERQLGGFPKLVLDRLPSTVASVKERADTATPLTLATNDYRVDGYILHRLSTGTNPRYFWDYGEVEVVHAVDDMPARMRVQVQIVKLDLEHAGWQSDSPSGPDTFSLSYQTERNQLLRTLLPALVA